MLGILCVEDGTGNVFQTMKFTKKKQIIIVN